MRKGRSFFCCALAGELVTINVSVAIKNPLSPSFIRLSSGRIWMDRSGREISRIPLFEKEGLGEIFLIPRGAIVPQVSRIWS